MEFCNFTTFILRFERGHGGGKLAEIGFFLLPIYFYVKTTWSWGPTRLNYLLFLMLVPVLGCLGHFKFVINTKYLRF